MTVLVTGLFETPYEAELVVNGLLDQGVSKYSIRQTTVARRRRGMNGSAETRSEGAMVIVRTSDVKAIALEELMMEHGAIEASRHESREDLENWPNEAPRGGVRSEIQDQDLPHAGPLMEPN